MPQRTWLAHLRAQLKVEALEQRMAPATLTVNTLADNNPTTTLSLRQAIAVVDHQTEQGLSAQQLAQITGTLGNHDRIQFTPGLAGTITLNTSSSDLEVTNNVVIAGPGADLLQIDGNQAIRVLHVGSGAEVSLSGLSIQNGKIVLSGVADGGGGIFNEGTLSLTNCLVTNNQVTVSLAGTGNETLYCQGGGIFNTGTITLDHCTLSDNSANLLIDDIQAGNDNGGGLYSNHGDVTLTDCTIVGNSANVQEAIQDGDVVAYGGGLTCDNGTLTMTGCTVANNNATGGASPDYPPSEASPAGRGGGIHVYSSTASLSNCTIVNNTTSSDTTLEGLGGGVSVQDAHLTLTSCTVTGNTATGTTLSGEADSSGGIYLLIEPSFTGSVTLQNTIVAGNNLGADRRDVSAQYETYDAQTQVYSILPEMFISGGHNLIGVPDGPTGWAGTDRTGTASSPLDPRLGTLGNNGGPTQTLPLLADSPAVGAGDPGLAGTPDQRGVPRSAPVSIGSYQGLATVTMVTASVGTSTYGQSVTFTATVTSGGSAAGGLVIFREGSSTLGTSRLDVSGRASYTTTTLGPGTHTISVAYAGNSTSQASTGNAGLTVNRAPLRITLDSKTKVYGQPLPILTVQSYQGLVNGDSPAVLSGLRLSTTATAASPVGTYPITASGAVADNYTIGTIDGTLTVTRASLTISADSRTRVYGEANPVLTVQSYQGLVNGDSQAVLSELKLSTTATAASPVGTYPITVGGAVADNYAISTIDGTLTVTRAPLTISADSRTRVYGEANPALTATFTGLVNRDTAVTALTGGLATTATDGSPVGTYPITQGTLEAANYTITFSPADLTVTRASLTISADNKLKLSGEPNPALSATYSGLVNGDSQTAVTGLTLQTTATPASASGDYPIIVSGAVAVNYQITFVAGTMIVLPSEVAIFRPPPPTPPALGSTLGSTSGSETQSSQTTQAAQPSTPKANPAQPLPIPVLQAPLANSSLAALGSPALTATQAVGGAVQLAGSSSGARGTTSGAMSGPGKDDESSDPAWKRALRVLPPPPPGPTLPPRVDPSQPETVPLDLSTDGSSGNRARPASPAVPLADPEESALLDEIYANFEDEPTEPDLDPVRLLAAGVPAVLFAVSFDRLPAGPDRGPKLKGRKEPRPSIDEQPAG
jgi:hypothetical protein